jgi:hypothetical protein
MMKLFRLLSSKPARLFILGINGPQLVLTYWHKEMRVFWSFVVITLLMLVTFVVDIRPKSTHELS